MANMGIVITTRIREVLLMTVTVAAAATVLAASRPALAGDAFKQRWHGKTDALLDTIARGMPLNAPGSLSLIVFGLPL
jgi:hypothetical protein